MDGQAQAFQTIPSPPPPPPLLLHHHHHHQTQVTNFGFHDCFNSSGNLEQLMNLIDGGNARQPNTNCCPNYQSSEDSSVSNPGSLISFGGAMELQENEDDMELQENEDEDEAEDEDENSMESVTQSRTRRVDRARMPVSERRRRWSRMKEKLLALRALVPNISKMDKASMVEDAILYIQNLHIQIKKLRDEVAGLEFSLGRGRESGNEVGRGRERFEKLGSPKPSKVQDKIQGCKKILQVDVFQVGEREFYVRSTCSRGEGVAVALYRALESMTCFDVQSSNVNAVSDRFVLTFTLNDRKGGEEMNVPTLKKLVIVALLTQGFELKTSGDP